MIFEFLSSIYQPNACLVVVSNQRSSLRCVETNILRKYKLLHLMAIYRSVSDSTRVIALCQVC